MNIVDNLINYLKYKDEKMLITTDIPMNLM